MPSKTSCGQCCSSEVTRVYDQLTWENSVAYGPRFTGAYRSKRDLVHSCSGTQLCLALIEFSVATEWVSSSL